MVKRAAMREFAIENLNTERNIPFKDAFRFLVKLGLISFGGPAGQIAIMHRELVDKRRWLSEERFLHALGLSGSINWFAVIPGIAAFIALYKFKIDVLWVVLCGGAIGLAKILLQAG